MNHFLSRTHIWKYLNGRNLLISYFDLKNVSVGYIKYGTLAKNSGYYDCPSSQIGGLDRLAEVEVVAKRIHVGWSEAEILRSLVSDERCGAIKVSHTLVNTLLRRFRDDWTASLGVFRWAESRSDYEHLPETCDSMVDILGKARQFDKMRSLVGEMQERNCISLNTVAKMMRRFTGARQWKDAVMTFDELRAYGLEKNTQSMNLLLDTLCKENQVEMARVIFLELKSHILPDRHTFTIFIHGWCKIKRVEEADWTLQEMKGYGLAPCVISYSIIIKSYCQMQNWSKVYELLDVMEAQGCEPSIVTYTTIMSSLTKSGLFDDSLMIADRVKSSGCKPDTMFYNALIHTLGKAQWVTEAFDVFKIEMHQCGVAPNTETYNTLISMFCHHGQEDMAFGLLEEMERSALCKPDLQTFYPLLKACIRSGLADNSLIKLLDDMSTKHHLSIDGSTYTLLIHGLCRADKCEWAAQLFEEIIEKELMPGYRTCDLLLDEVKQKKLNDIAERLELHIKNLRSSKTKFPGEHFMPLLPYLLTFSRNAAHDR